MNTKTHSITTHSITNRKNHKLKNSIIDFRTKVKDFICQENINENRNEPTYNHERKIEFVHHED
jgi:hypothetical protein